MNSDGTSGRIADPVPGTAAIVATSYRGDSVSPQGYVLLENGDAYRSEAGGWVFIGNLFDAPTSITPETMGPREGPLPEVGERMKAAHRVPVTG